MGRSILHCIFKNLKTKQMKNLISTKEAKKAARTYFGVERLAKCDHYVMGGNNPYHLFIYKGNAFEIR